MSVAFDHTETVAEVETTDDHRLVIGPELVRDGRYYLSKLKDGSVLLTPIESVPEEERAVWENPLIRESLGRGMAQALDGDLVDWDDVFGDESA